MDKIQIKEMFASNINRNIEEVIKVDQDNEEIVREELKEYVVTDSIKDFYRQILRRYWETPNKPHEGIGIWVSGFFGSGKSSFAKMLGLAIENKSILKESAANLFGQRTGDTEIQVLLKQITEQIPTDAVIFDLSTDRGIKSGNQTITEIMYRLFLKNLGYAEDLDLAELEITLEHKKELDKFTETYRNKFDQEWDANKDLIAFSLGEAGAVMHQLYPDRYETGDSWVQSVIDRTDISAGKLAERCKSLMGRRRPDRNLVFVVDEVGQFVARDVQKMLDLQGVVQSLGRISRGKVWLVVTSQEKLTDLVAGLDDRRVELARLMDRFPIQVHLEPSDISEVTSKRVLSKNANAEKILRDIYSAHNGRLMANTKLSADIQLPELTAETFMDLYPLLPYQIDLIIQVVSGLRTQGGASKHVGGANRTIIKLAQQLLIHDTVGLAEQNVGQLARIDQIYDLIAGNLPSEIRGKIIAIKDDIAHPMAQSVAKAICLLQYVKSIHRTAENVAAALHPAVDGDSVLTETRDALKQLADAHKIRFSDGQYRIPTPAEDDWETTRASFQPNPGDINRIHTSILSGLWEPKPSHNLLDAKTFKGGLTFNGRNIIDEDITFHITLADTGDDYSQLSAEARKRSQTDRKEVFWVVAIAENIDRETVEVFRSKEILSRKERSAKTRVETGLVGEEKVRLRDTESELRRLIKEAMLGGVIYFRGNDRSPDENVDRVNKAAAHLLSKVLPDVFDRFSEGAARVSSKDLDALFASENLRGLTSVYSRLNLVQDKKGRPVFSTETGALKEVLDRIENKTSYGETATGRFLVDVFSKEPFGWNLEVVRLFVICLVAAGKISATSKGTIIESVLSIEAKNTFSNNNLFRGCSFLKRVSGTNMNDWIESDAAFQDVFGKRIPQLQASIVANSIRKELVSAEVQLREMHTILITQNLPGDGVLQETIDQIQAIRNGTEDIAILTFNAGYKVIKEAIKRAAELHAALTEPNLDDLKRAGSAIDTIWTFLITEINLPEGLSDKADDLDDFLKKETFYRNLAEIEQNATAIENEYRRRFNEALESRAQVYKCALEKLHKKDAWFDLNEKQQSLVDSGLRLRATLTVQVSTTVPFLRSEVSACPEHFRSAVKMMMELIEGQRLVTVNIEDFFTDRVENPEQLEKALKSLKLRVEKLLGEGKKILIN